MQKKIIPKFRKINFLIIIFSFLFFNGCTSNNDLPEVKVKSEEETQIENYLEEGKVLSVAISTMLSPKETFSLYEELLKYIEEKAGYKIKLKQRRTYKEVNDLLKEGKLDFALVCTGAYLVAQKEFNLELLAAPVIEGKTFYQAYIIVNRNSSLVNFSDLRGKSFAFTDPLSNTGYSYVIKLLKDKNTAPEEFFNRTIFTYAHDNSIQAVSRNLVDGATVDGLVFDYLKEKTPERVEQLKVIHKSEWFGIPPFVYVPGRNDLLIKEIQKILIEMHLDETGKKILDDLSIDKFVIVKPEIYKGIEIFN